MLARLPLIVAQNALLRETRCLHSSAVVVSLVRSDVQDGVDKMTPKRMPDASSAMVTDRTHILCHVQCLHG